MSSHPKGLSLTGFSAGATLPVPDGLKSKAVTEFIAIGVSNPEPMGFMSRMAEPAGILYFSTQTFPAYEYIPAVSL